MKFGEVALADAASCVLAHSVKLHDGTLRKGMVLGEPELLRLALGGIARVVVARIESHDVTEDIAAARIASALGGIGVETGGATTGRVNLYASHGGLLALDATRIEAANQVDEGLTIATLHADSVVKRGQMLATIKIIPYAVHGETLHKLLLRLDGAHPALAVAGWRGISVGLVMTHVGDAKSSMLAKMRNSVVQRLEPLGGTLVAEAVVPHQEAPLAAALATLLAGAAKPDLLLVSGAAATVDREDVVPAAVVLAGGTVLHAGMPVDPGNLLVLARLPIAGQACPVVGIPTCARSPKLNGFDFVLRRFAAGMPVTSQHLMAMGVGGLLTEIENRPMPRETRR
jgi:molybdenum cofactor cytidylyltransferase